MRFRTVVRSIEGARKQIAGNSKMAATPMDYRSEISKPMIFYFIFDISGSMTEFYDELVDCFNCLMLPVLKEASQRYKGAIRIGCLLFSKRLVPAWYGYKTLTEIGPEPLKRSMLIKKGLGGRTALYNAMRVGIFWTTAAMEYMRNNGRGEFPKGKVIVFTDGANTDFPKREKTVKKALDSIGNLNLRNLQPSVVFLNTNNGLEKGQVERMCEQTGFTLARIIKIDSDGNPGERKRSFRHQIRSFFQAHGSPL